MGNLVLRGLGETCDTPSLYSVLTANIIPAMTSATAPSGVASASSEYNAGYAAWKAFDHLNIAGGGDPAWASAGDHQGTGKLQYQFPVAHVITQYAVTSRNAPLAADVQDPKTWTFEGSNDGLTWTTLDTQTNVVDWAGMPNVRKVFNLVNTVAYAYCRLNIAAHNNINNSYVSVGELEMMEALEVMAGSLLTLGGMGGGEEAPAIVTELSCAMRNSAEFEIEPDQRASVMTTGCDMRSGARMSVRPLREGVVLPETDDLGWTVPDATASPLWDLTVTIGGLRIPNAAVTSFTIELDAHGGFESCAISFASKRSRKWASRTPIVVAYDGMHPCEGRLATQRRSIGTELGWSLEFVGDLNDLRNHRAFRRVYVDSDLANWRSDQGPNTQANVFEVTASE